MALPFLTSFALFLAHYAISSLLTPTQRNRPATLEEFDFPQVEEGTEQAVFFGDCWTEDWQVLWYGNLRTKKIKQGGKK
ncbi:hypothetical protein [Alterisphingorhabdus coralli]|uniref:Uncharacterized protein n=1 Tax=Alterisphingorhabdus coralli TaxID=3071408 RepID=A0AA97FA23_9SPHN|nr:hypothetical protein [Parasphingorhabdus sp. SCSIO 66989]WOE76326.1 hypothetical protein RB602_06335 [Parasphingorhabdus sp. SCSIO 66989]